MKKKNGSSHPEIWTCTPTIPPAKKCGLWPLGHATTTPKLKVLKYFFCHSHCSNLVELYLSWIQRYIWGRVAQNEYFKTISRYLRVYSLSRYIGRSINGLVSFIAALVQPETSPAAKSNEKRMLSQASWSSGHRSFGVKTPIARISGYLSNRIFMESSLTFHLCLNSRSIVLWQSRGLYNW